MAATKIATCCYCGTKAALVLRGSDRHELTCGNCGAPLHAMKMLPVQKPAPKRHAEPVPTYTKRQEKRPKKVKKRKTLGRRMMSGLWDALEDVVDEVFD